MKAGGVDAVNVTDNPMARLRMSSIAVAALIQRETGLDAVVQITTRDRNVLGLQSDLLGAAGLGLKAILCLGGDPLKIGDYPQAKQVSEVDVLGLLRIAQGLNSGADLAGNAIGAPTRFAIACAANPAAADQEVEFSKLRAKIEAGATFAQTQPVYDLDALARFLERPEAQAIPILDRPDPPALAQADALLRQRGAGSRRPAGHPGPHAAGGREAARSTRGPRVSRSPGSSPPGSPASPGASTSCRWASTIPRARSSRRSPARALRIPGRPRSREPRRSVRCIGGNPVPARGVVSPCGPDFNRIRQRRRDRPDRRNGAARRRTMKTTKRMAVGARRSSAAGDCTPVPSAADKGVVTDAAERPSGDATITVTTPEPRRPSTDLKTDKKGQYGRCFTTARCRTTSSSKRTATSTFEATRRSRSATSATVDAKLTKQDGGPGQGPGRRRAARCLRTSRPSSRSTRAWRR